VIGWLGIAAMSTKPVTNVPKSAPTVPTADSWPTTDPVASRECSDSLAATGVTIDSTAAGRKKPIPARATMVAGASPEALGPTTYTRAGEATESTPPRIRIGPRSLEGSQPSASRPPAHAPRAIAARTVPMMPVKVWRLTPT